MFNITNKIVSKLPKIEFNGKRSEKFIKWFGKNISTPENRIIIGVTAVLSQPLIDYYNKDVDKKTAKTSSIRSFAKNIAGMTSGFLVRKGFIKLTQQYSALGNVERKIQKLFTPSLAKQKDFAYKQYQNAMGMVFAILGLCVTNFAFDIPVTNYLTNVINKKLGGNNEKR